MLTWLSEDPWPMAGFFGLIALLFFVALRMTQQGQYLIRGCIALGLAALVLCIEHFWVTDTERLEAVVYSLARAVESSDIPGIMTHFTPNVQFKQGGETIEGVVFDEEFVRSHLERAQFDFVKVRKLTTEVSPQARRGSAEFEVFLSGTQLGNGSTLNAGTFPSSWSLGFQETAPHVWKVNEVRPIRLPYGVLFRNFRQRSPGMTGRPLEGGRQAAPSDVRRDPGGLPKVAPLPFPSPR